MAARYQIVIQPRPGIPNYQLLQAVGQISTGDEILAERPIAELQLSLTEIYDFDILLHPQKAKNGKQSLQTMRDNLPDEDRTLMLAL